MIFKDGNLRYNNYVDALRGQFGDLTSLVSATNRDVFEMRKNQTNLFMQIGLDKIQVGRFYLINYEFNGNKLYYPILSIDYRVSNNKHILYAINLDYLPFDYKKMFFNKVYNDFEPIFSNNYDAENVLSENPLPINFEMIYNSLKDNGKFHYAISAFDILKIKECFLVSTSLMYIMTHIHMRKINIALMKETMKNYEDDDYKNKKLKYTITELEKMEESFDNDVISFYKRFKSLESNYKLFEND